MATRLVLTNRGNHGTLALCWGRLTAGIAEGPMGLPGRKRKLIAGIVFVVVTTLVFLLVSPYLSLEYLESQRSFFAEIYGRRPILVPALYLLISAVLIGLALPFTGVLALLGGALFGFTLGWIMSSIAGTVGALMVFLWSRYLFRDWLQRRFQRQFTIVNRGIEEEGVYYLFSIRLVAVFPFFLVNLLCGLTNISAYAYTGITFAGQTIVVALWVYAGARIASLVSVGEILTVESVLVLFIVGLLPFASHRLLNRLRIRLRQ